VSNITTQCQLKELLHYNPDSGIFTWKVSRGVAVAGKTAGGLSEQGYTRISFEKRLHRASRLAWLYMHGEWPAHVIDHINGIRNDDRFENLRHVTVKQNSENRGASPRNKLGAKGVHFIDAYQKFSAHIKNNGVGIGLGNFDTLLDAVAAYKNAERRLFTHSGGH
jgi:HNH endonuclease